MNLAQFYADESKCVGRGGRVLVRSGGAASLMGGKSP